MSNGPRPPSPPRPVVAAAGRWLFLGGLFLLVTGDGPMTSVRAASWRTPVPALGWPWLYLLLLGASMLCWIAGRSGTDTPARLRFLAPLLAILLVVFTLSTLFSNTPALSWYALLAVVGIGAFGWYAGAMLEDETVGRWIWPTVGAAILVLALRVLMWRRDEGLSVVAFQVLNNAWVGKLQLSWVFNLCAPFLLARALEEPRRGRAAFYAAAWAIAGLATFLLFSRMGILVFAASTAVVGLLNRGSWRKGAAILAMAAVLGAIPLARTVTLSREVAGSTFESARNPGVGIRLGVWRDALRLFRADPLLGSGLGSFDEAAYLLPGTNADTVFRRNGWHAHNVYLHVLAETGVLGLLAWCLVWYAIVVRLAQAVRGATGAPRLRSSAALCAVLAFLALSTTEVLIAARVEASLRMNLLVVFVTVLALHVATPRPGASG